MSTPSESPYSAAAPMTFEAAVAELESIVHAMEGSKLPLEDALSSYQRGIELLRHCQGALSAAEQRIRVLEGDTLRDLPADNDTA